MNNIINWLLMHMISEECIQKEEKDIYQFGIECLLLKSIHYISYLVIAFFLHSIINLMITASIFVPLRNTSGGYHAKTRIGCYIFSCFMVIAICMIDKIYFPMWIYFAEGIVANATILLWAPIENDNRTLEEFEKHKFHNRAIFLVLISDVIIFFLMADGNSRIAGCLLHGIMVAATLLLMGKYKVQNNI